ncbi:hypothetical protein [Mycetohabitans endofungorum]|uniref:hypothetical protein n=1 Tax=Mycetohabitans endofungorum TaxID=417203 RepID=UPI0026AB4962
MVGYLPRRQLHNLLAKYGLGLREKGRGFAIYDVNSGDTTPTKASDMHEELGKTRLTKRLGPFKPSMSTTDAVLTYDKHRPLKHDPKIREERRQEHAEARRELRARYGEYKRAFVYRDSTRTPCGSDPWTSARRLVRSDARSEKRFRSPQPVKRCIASLHSSLCGSAIGCYARSAKSVRRYSQTQ